MTASLPLDGVVRLKGCEMSKELNATKRNYDTVAFHVRRTLYRLGCNYRDLARTVQCRHMIEAKISKLLLQSILEYSKKW